MTEVDFQKPKMYKFIILAVLVIAAEAAKAKAKTECQQHREREMKSKAPLPMRLIPECDEKGDYKARQCFKDSKFCACWDKKGNPVTQPSTKIKACECPIQKHAADKNARPGNFKPQCAEDGKFLKQQCHSSTGYCWCAHPETGVKTSEPKRGKPKC